MKAIINAKKAGTYVEPGSSSVDRPEFHPHHPDYSFDKDRDSEDVDSEDADSSEEEEQPAVIVKPEDILPVIDPVNLTPSTIEDEDEDSDDQADDGSAEEDEEDEEIDDDSEPEGAEEDIF